MCFLLSIENKIKIENFTYLVEAELRPKYLQAGPLWTHRDYFK